MRALPSARAARILVLMLLLIGAGFCLFPLVLALINSFKTDRRCSPTSWHSLLLLICPTTSEASRRCTICEAS